LTSSIFVDVTGGEGEGIGEDLGTGLSKDLGGCHCGKPTGCTEDTLDYVVETMFRLRNTDEVIKPIVSCDAVKVVDLMIRRNRFTAPCEIDRMGDEDMLV
jgi:hypothetical protein